MSKSTPSNAKDALGSLRDLSSEKDAAILQRFFKTGPGEYGEGDVFWGVRVPGIRSLIPRHIHMPLKETGRLLASPVHEARLLALLILVKQYPKADEAGKKAIFDFYLNNTARINNWDLIDLSTDPIIGAWLYAREKFSVLDRLAASPSLWERRMAIMATFRGIKMDRFDITLRMAEKLLHDREDLIHKAVGWMLRETGKRDQAVEEVFLRRHYKTMPRTMLRYAIERFPEPLRLAYLHGKIT